MRPARLAAATQRATPHGCRSASLPCLAFGYEFGGYDTEDGAGRYLCLFSDGNGDLDQVVLLVQKFLRAFRPTETWTITYATTCSKPRCGAFGGGAGIITADNIEWRDAELIADEAREQIALQLTLPATSFFFSTRAYCLATGAHLPKKETYARSCRRPIGRDSRLGRSAVHPKEHRRRI